MEYSALQYALKAQRRLGFTLLILLGNQRRGGIDKFGQFAAQAIKVSAAGVEHIYRRLVVQQSQQQMFDGHELMTLVARFLERQIQGDLEISVEHVATSYAMQIALLRFPFNLTHQRVLAFPRVFIYFCRLGLGNVTGIDTANRSALSMHPQHDLRSTFTVV